MCFPDILTRIHTVYTHISYARMPYMSPPHIHPPRPPRPASPPPTHTHTTSPPRQAYALYSALATQHGGLALSHYGRLGAALQAYQLGRVSDSLLALEVGGRSRGGGEEGRRGGGINLQSRVTHNSKAAGGGGSRGRECGQRPRVQPARAAVSPAGSCSHPFRRQINRSKCSV